MIRTATDLDECRELWHRLSPGNDAWDDWALMFAFHDEERHRFHFLVHETDEGVADGLVPLIYDQKNDRYMLMAGSYPDGRILWIDYEHFPEVFSALPERSVFFDLKQRWVSGLLESHRDFEANFAEQDLRYFLVPADFEFDFYKHIDRFAPEKRQKFLYDLRNIQKREPVLHWSNDNEADLFIELVNRNFGPASDYADADNANEVRRVINELERSGRLRTLVIEIDGSRRAVSLSAVHGDRMIALYASSNNDYNNLGKLLNVETIQEACRLQVDEISYMTGMRWKADWNMQGEACVTMRKPPAPWP